MGVDRHITYKGNVISTIGRAYRYEDLPDNHEIYIELWRLIRLYDSDFEEFIEGVGEWVENVKNCGGRDLLEYMCEDEGMGWVDE